RAGIDKHLSFHVSRHSFADMARTKGMDLYSISKALGHANVRVTERYLKGFDAGALDEAMEALFEDHG
ncbi:MAG: site-specific integrase, partial [Caldilineae bacterium]